jgi:hypothetical protein
MRGRRVVVQALLSLIVFLLFLPGSLGAQGSSRIWGRVTTVDGDIYEGFIRWDRNEGSWGDLLDGSKDVEPFESEDWWGLYHPGEERSRDRVIEYGGYRITWDDDEPDFPSSFESGIRFGHIRRLTVDEDEARLELRSGGEAALGGLWSAKEVVLHGGLTDLGRDLREILVREESGREIRLEWEDLAEVELTEAPPGSTAPGERLHGTVQVKDGPSFTGFIAWDLSKILTTDTLEGEDGTGREREYLFEDVSSIHPTEDGSEITLRNGDRIRLSGGDDVDRGNDGIQVSDPGLGMVDLDWEDLETVRFHPPDRVEGLDSFEGGRRLRGTVMTVDSTEIEGWIRWDGDEAFAWELLDGRNGNLGFDVELGKVATIERFMQAAVTVSMGTAGVRVDHPLTEGARIILRDGRELELEGSNDVDENNHGVFVLPFDRSDDPDDPQAVWIRVGWEDFRSIRFDWEEIQ